MAVNAKLLNITTGDLFRIMLKTIIKPVTNNMILNT